MKNTGLLEIVGKTDVYLLDQILKNNYKPGDKILDAGCGTGRNLTWFVQNNFDIVGVDRDPKVIEQVQSKYTLASFHVSNVESMPFDAGSFDHIICNAVLHFASGSDHFDSMFGQLIQVLKQEGTLFIRMTSNIGIEQTAQHIEGGVYKIPDGSKRFLLTREIYRDLLDKYPIAEAELLKTVNVNDVRCMSTMVLRKT